MPPRTAPRSRSQRAVRALHKRFQASVVTPSSLAYLHLRSMTRYFRHRCKGPFIAGALLIALLFQAMIPAGFMPAADGKFALQVCPHDSNTHTGGHSHVE